MRQSNKYSEKVSSNITMYEATKSWTAIKNGIDNTPNESQLFNMKLLAENIFEPLRQGLGGLPINVSIFFRCIKLNTKIGGAKGSQHIAEKGAAIDLDVDSSNYLYNYQLFNFIKDNLDFDQLIWEHGDKLNPDWVHVSYNQGKNRGQILVAYKVWNEEDEEFETKYKPYL
jgi:hypothetical protein